MLHTETIAPATLELLKALMREKALSGFVLVGGTSLALQIGHRESVDLDLFTDSPFDAPLLSERLSRSYGFTQDLIHNYTLKGEISGVQVDCIAHQYAWLDGFVVEDGIRMASARDIAAMKLNAIVGNGTRLKDFIDIAHLSSLLSLNEMLDAYAQKYESNTVMALKGLFYWNDIDFDEPIRMTRGKHQWRRIEERLKQMQETPTKVFATGPQLAQVNPEWPSTR